MTMKRRQRAKRVWLSIVVCASVAVQMLAVCDVLFMRPFDGLRAAGDLVLLCWGTWIAATAVWRL